MANERWSLTRGGFFVDPRMLSTVDDPSGASDTQYSEILDSTPSDSEQSEKIRFSK